MEARIFRLNHICGHSATNAL